MNKSKKQYCFLMCVALMPVIGCGCQQKTLVIKDEEKTYQAEMGYDEESKIFTWEYVPKPDIVVSVKAIVIATKPSLIRSQSFATETKTLFQLLKGESIPQKPSIRKVHVSYYEAHEPQLSLSLKKGDMVELLFDGQGDFINFKFLA